MASAPPGVPEKVEAAEAQLAHQCRQLLHEELDRPERCVVGPLRVPTPQLVVEQDTPAGRGQGGNRLEVVVGQARAAMDNDDRRPSRRTSADAVPHPVTSDDH